MVFKLGTSNVRHKRNRTTPTILFLWQHPWFQSLSLKNQIPPFATFESKTESFALNTHGSHMVLTVANRLLGVDDPCLK